MSNSPVIVDLVAEAKEFLRTNELVQRKRQQQQQQPGIINGSVNNLGSYLGFGKPFAAAPTDSLTRSFAEPIQKLAALESKIESASDLKSFQSPITDLRNDLYKHHDLTKPPLGVINLCEEPLNKVSRRQEDCRIMKTASAY